MSKLPLGILVLSALASPAQAQQKQLYFLRAESSADQRVSRINLDGSGLEDLVTGALTRQPNSLAIDPGENLMYWSDSGPEPVGKFIKRANLEIPDGETAETRTDIENIVPLESIAAGIVLDLPAGKMHWFDGNKLYKANLDGTDKELILDPVGAATNDVVLYDPLAGNVPAVGGVGLFVIAASMIAAGAWVMKRRTRAAGE